VPVDDTLRDVRSSTSDPSRVRAVHRYETCDMEALVESCSRELEVGLNRAVESIVGVVIDTESSLSVIVPTRKLMALDASSVLPTLLTFTRT